MAEIKPFHFRLAKLSRRQLDLAQGLLEFLPKSGLHESFHLAIRKALQKYLPDFRYFLDRITETNFHDFFTGLANPCCIGVLGMEPFDQKGFVEIDPVISFLVIEKLLGGKPEARHDLSPLTETEQGVVEFLLLKLLAEIHKTTGEKSKIHLRLEKMVLEPMTVRDFEEKAELVCLKIHVSLLKHSGFINIYLPSPWVLEGFLKDLPKNKKGWVETLAKQNLHHFDSLKIDVWGSLGAATISARDLEGLEEGDVVLLDQCSLKKKKGSWEGSVDLLVGEGLSGGFRASWKGFQDEGHVQLSGVL